MGSSRLPGKVMKTIGGMPLIGLMVSRLEKSLLLDKIVVATSADSSDDVLCGYLDKASIEYFRGSNTDVMHRMLQAAEKHGAETIIRMTADCPLIDPSIVDYCISKYHNVQGLDYVGSTSLSDYYPRGQDACVFSIDTLREVDGLLMSDSHFREHVSLYIYGAVEAKYRCESIGKPDFDIDKNIRLTVDYDEDLVVVGKIVESLGNYCSLHEVVRFLSENNGLLDINRDLVKTEYENNRTRHGG